MSHHLQVAALDAFAWFSEMQDKGIDLAASACQKAANEGKEFADEPSLEEAADVVIATLGGCYHHGWSVHDLANAMLRKLQVNRARTWEQVADGTWQHK